ncbi:MAG: prolipoprotein diacylglyceryl transferase [Candidatus Cloacimonetes bacterium]|nr:prolipoprotein diacylglyceryl transferase [Candidatus Cloacimonadota bacterium]
MIKFPDFNPNILCFQIGNFPLQIRWYGVLYIISFVLGYIFAKKFFKYRNIKMDKEKYETFIFDIALGVILGGRLGYVFFYDLPAFLHNPLVLFQVWNGGMSFHGGALGVIFSILYFCKKYKYNFIAIGDISMPLVAVGLGFGRLGNFINAELYGNPTSVPWAMIFPTDSLGLPRHPTQLYEMFLEGFLMFILLWVLLIKSKKIGIVFWSFFPLYGIFRIFIEFFREKDNIPSLYPNGLLFGFLPISMGQFLSLFMIIIGAYGIYKIYSRKMKT